MFTQKGIFMTTWLDLKQSLIKSIQKKDKKIRQYIRKDDLAAKRDGGVIDWGYLLNAEDSF